MKPSEHPELFRFPPPAGRSRESTIVLDRHGHFYHDGRRVEHRGIAGGLARWLSRHPEDGRYILQNGYDWCYLTVEDTPFFIVSLRPDKSGAEVTLSDGTTEPLDPRSVTVGEDGVLRAMVKEGRFAARFTQPAQLRIAPLLVTDSPPTIRLGGQDYVLKETTSPSPEAEPDLGAPGH